MHKLYLKLLVAILHLLMRISEEQTGSRYSWTNERKLLQEANAEINK